MPNAHTCYTIKSRQPGWRESPPLTSDLWKPMGQALAAGMGFATIVTLLGIPSIYYLLERRGERKRLAYLSSCDRATSP